MPTITGDANLYDRLKESGVSLYSATSAGAISLYNGLRGAATQGNTASRYSPAVGSARIGKFRVGR
jgi:hypothetical protein